MKTLPTTIWTSVNAALIAGILLVSWTTQAEENEELRNTTPPVPLITGTPLPPINNPVIPPPRPPVGPLIDPVTGQPLPTPPKITFSGSIEGQRLPTFDIDNLSLSELVDALRNRFREVNFLLPRNVQAAADERNMSLKVRLINVSLRDILNAIIYATDGEIAWNQVTENMVVFQMRRDLQSPASSPSRTPVSQRTAQVINLGRIWGGMSQTDTEQLIDEVRSLTSNTLLRLYDNFDPEKNMTKPNYHPGTGVLVLVGPDYANKVFMDILKNIEPKSRRAPIEKSNVQPEGASSAGSVKSK